MNHSLSDYLKRFESLVDSLRRDDNIKITYLNVNAPAPPETIEWVENTIQAKLHDSIKSFFTQADGLSLLWTYKDNEAYDELEKPDPNIWSLTDRGGYDGCVNIHPLERVFITEDWQFIHDDDSEVEFMNQNTTYMEFTDRLRALDYFSFYQGMAFYLEEGNGNPPLLMGDDHLGCWTDSRVTDFTSYMEMALANKFAVEARQRIYSKYDGHSLPPIGTPREFWTKKNSYILREGFPEDFPDEDFFD